MYSSLGPFKYFLHTVMEGNIMEPSSMLEVEVMVFLSTYLRVADIVCHKKRANRTSREILCRYFFFITVV